MGAVAKKITYDICVPANDKEKIQNSRGLQSLDNVGEDRLPPHL